MIYGSPLTGVSTRIPAHEAEHARIFVALYMGKLVLLIAMAVAAFLVRGRPSRVFAYRLMTSLALMGLRAIVEMAHWSLLLGKKLPLQSNSTYNFRVVFTTLLLESAQLVMLICMMDVLHNRLLAVFRGGRAKKVLTTIHATITVVMAALAVCDIGITANWATKLVNEGSHSTAPMNAWNLGVSFATALETIWLLVMIYVATSAGIGAFCASKRGAYTQNFLGLIFCGSLLCISKVFSLASGYFALFGETTDHGGLRTLMLRMLSKTVPLLFAYAGLVVMAKRHHEFITNQQVAMSEKGREYQANRAY